MGSMPANARRRQEARLGQKRPGDLRRRRSPPESCSPSESATRSRSNSCRTSSVRVRAPARHAVPLEDQEQVLADVSLRKMLAPAAGTASPIRARRWSGNPERSWPPRCTSPSSGAGGRRRSGSWSSCLPRWDREDPPPRLGSRRTRPGPHLAAAEALRQPAACSVLTASPRAPAAPRPGAPRAGAGRGRARRGLVRIQRQRDPLADQHVAHDRIRAARPSQQHALRAS